MLRRDVRGLSERVKHYPTEDERYCLLEDNVVLVGVAPHVPPGDGLVLGWPTSGQSLLRLLELVANHLFVSYSPTDAMVLEFWVDETFYTRALTQVIAMSVVNTINVQLYSPSDILRLVRMGTATCAAEISFDEQRRPVMMSLVVPNIRLRAVMPIIQSSHENPLVRADREIVLAALSEPSAVNGALHLLRPSPVLP